MEATQKPPLDPEREALIAQMLRDAKTVNIPSPMEKEKVLNPEDKDAPPTVLREVSSAGYVYIWDSRTYEKIPVLYYMLGQVLRTRRDDGSWRFQTNDPGKLPKRGTLLCMLHKDSPNRAHYDELGFRVCPKDHIPNSYQVNQHMRKKHPAEWATIKEEKDEQEKQEDRRVQRLLMEKVAGEPASTEKVEKTKTEKARFICDLCKADFGSQKTLERHIKEQHK